MLERKTRRGDDTHSTAWSWHGSLRLATIFLSATGSLMAAYLGFGLLTFSVLGDSDTFKRGEGCIRSRGWLPVRRLLSMPENITDIDAVPDLQFEASQEDQCLLDSSAIFGSNVVGNGVFSEGRAALPSWLAYCPSSSCLMVIAPGPSLEDANQWAVQVKNKSGVLLWSKTLMVMSGVVMGASSGEDLRTDIDLERMALA